MDAEFIVAIVGAITGILGIVVSIRTARASARKDEVEALRGIIADLRTRVDRLKAENAELEGRVKELEAENLRLRKWINRLETENAQLKYREEKTGDGKKPAVGSKARRQ